jgi:hypothetical protein
VNGGSREHSGSTKEGRSPDRPAADWRSPLLEMVVF